MTIAHQLSFTCRVSGQGNGIGPVCLCVRQCVHLGLCSPHCTPLHKGLVAVMTQTKISFYEGVGGARMLGHFHTLCLL